MRRRVDRWNHALGDEMRLFQGLEVEVLEGRKNLVLAKNTIEELESERDTAQGRIAQVIALIEELRAELAEYDEDTLAEIERVEKLQTDIKNLEEEVEAGRFRKELFYQLNVVPLHIPALREHPEDVTELLEYYSNYFATHERLPYRRFSMAAQNFLRQYSWPGNIRELKNLVQRLMILGGPEEIGLEEVEQALGASPQAVMVNSRIVVHRMSTSSLVSGVRTRPREVTPRRAGPR